MPVIIETVQKTKSTSAKRLKNFELVKVTPDIV